PKGKNSSGQSPVASLSFTHLNSAQFPPTADQPGRGPAGGAHGAGPPPVGINPGPPAETAGMQRTLRALFRRDPSRDRLEKNILFAGYQVYWPDGRPVSLS